MNMKMKFMALVVILYAIHGNAQTPAIATHQPNVRVFPTSAKNQSEVSISISTKDPTNIIVSANTSPNVSLITQASVTTGFYVSKDGGVSYTANESDAMPNGQDGFSDPSTCFDVDGEIFLSSLNHAFPNSQTTTSNGGRPFAILLQTSSNEGLNWSNSVNVFSNATDWVDKEAVVAIDDNANSPFVQNIYCAWTDIGAGSTLKVSTSNNNGLSFQGPTIASSNGCLGANVQTGPNGEVYVASSNSVGNGLIYFQFSNNGALTFQEMTPISFGADIQGAFGSGNPEPAFGNIRMNQFPSMAVDKSCGIHRGRIYVAYMYAEGDIGLDEQGTISLSYSDNNGLTWNRGGQISIPEASQAFLPWIAVDEQTGLVTIVYYAFDDPNTLFSTNTYVAYSTDGASSWQNIKVSDVSHITGPITGAGVYGGDYIGICAFGGKAFAAWHDNRPVTVGQTNGVSPWQVYVSEIDFTGLASSQTSIQGNITIDNSTTLTGLHTYHAGGYLTTINPISNM